MSTTGLRRAPGTDGRGLQRAMAILPLGLAGLALLDYPWGQPLLFALLLGVLVVCLRWPVAWLWAVPAMLPLVDLAPWSGRLFLQDIDILLLGVLATCLWHGQFRLPRHTPVPRIPLFFVTLLLASLVASLHLGLAPYPELGRNAFSSYYSPYNALRVARGIAWALLLALPLHHALRRHPREVAPWLLTGTACGLLGTGLVALWERGVVHDLFHARDRYDLLDGLLDFSTPYRVTGLFSGMHTGGEAIDGYLALAWPCALALLLLPGARAPLRMLGAVTLPLGLYAVATTFSRASYLALFVSCGLLGLGLLLVLTRRGGATRTAGLLTGGVLVLIAASLAYARGGTLAVATVLTGYGLCFAVGYLGRRLPQPLVVPLVVVMVPTTMALLWHALRSSKWVTNEGTVALLLATLLPLLATGLGLAMGRVARHLLRPREALTLALLGGTAMMAVLPALGGFRMETRFATAGADLAMRTTHWREALALRPPDLLTRLFGAGLGTFPRAYFLAYPERLDGVALLQDDGDDTVLALTGGKDVKVVQRLPLPAHQTYRLALDYRLDDAEARLRIRLCRRQMIQPLEYNDDCVTQRVSLRATAGEWQHFETRLALGDLGVGTGERGRAPLMIELANRREYDLMARTPSVLLLDRLSLTDSSGLEWLANGDFSAGFDRWFTLYDFNHLPWHIKNMTAHLLFEQGLCGLLSVLGLVLCAFARGIPAARRGDPLAQALGLAVTGFLTVGAVGTLFDEPRILTLFLLFVLTLAFAPATSAHDLRQGRPT